MTSRSAQYALQQGIAAAIAQSIRLSAYSVARKERP